MKTSFVPVERIETTIPSIRGERVILDSDLAQLYGVETRVLNHAVGRNLNRFPKDSIFSLTREEILGISQSVTSSKDKFSKHLYAFTEQGVAMLSSVLRSERAVKVNVEIMRAFVRLRTLTPSPSPKGRGEQGEDSVGVEVGIASYAPSPQPSPKGRGSKSRHYRGGYQFAGLVNRARELRKKQTPAEGLLWELLRGRRLLGMKFRRQHQFGDYIADFYCHEAQLVIECDGSVHESNEQWHHDQNRDAYMIAQGLRVLRFKNEQILDNTENMLDEIASFLPSPLGRGAGGEGLQEESNHVTDLLPSTFGGGAGGGGAELEGPQEEPTNSSITT